MIRETGENSKPVIDFFEDGVPDFNFFEEAQDHNNSPNAEPQYDLFRWKSQQVEIFNISQLAADYLYDNDISALVLVDRSARPAWVGVKTYWDQVYEEERPMPSIFFVNPAGFKEEADEGMATRVKTEHPFLGKYKSEPILILDTCLHFGQSLTPVVEGLLGANFEDVHIGVASNKQNFSGLKPDLILVGHRIGCYPFSMDQSVSKGEKLYSEVAEEGREHGQKIRSEIKNIILQNLEAETESEIPAFSVRTNTDLSRVVHNLQVIARTRKKRLVAKFAGAALGLYAGVRLGVESETDTTSVIIDSSIGMIVGYKGTSILAKLVTPTK